MTYYSLQEIENKYPESENDSLAKRIANKKTKNQAIKRFNERYQKSLKHTDASFQTVTLCSKTTASATERKRKLREALKEQKTNIQDQNKTSKHESKNELSVNKKRKISSHSKTTASATERKRKSRKALKEHKANIQNQNKTRYESKNELSVENIITS